SPRASAEGGNGMGEPSHHHAPTMASAVSPNASSAGPTERRVRTRDTALPLTLQPREAKVGAPARALCWTEPAPSWHAKGPEAPRSRPNRAAWETSFSRDA